MNNSDERDYAEEAYNAHTMATGDGEIPDDLFDYLADVDEVTGEPASAPSGPRPVYVIAREIRRDWTKIYFGAVPYLDAMGSLDSMADRYGLDSAKSIVSYFLANAGTWRGEVARRIKAELKVMGEGLPY